jgi:hypothetical protein
MIVVQRKPYQQQTLSIRISEFMRDYLERAKEIINSEPGQSYSTSDVANSFWTRSKKTSRTADPFVSFDWRGHRRALDRLADVDAR